MEGCRGLKIENTSKAAHVTSEIRPNTNAAKRCLKSVHDHHHHHHKLSCSFILSCQTQLNTSSNINAKKSEKWVSYRYIEQQWLGLLKSTKMV